MVLPLRYTMLRAETSDLSFSNMLLLLQNCEIEQLKVCCVWGIGFHPKSTVTALYWNSSMYPTLFNPGAICHQRNGQPGHRITQSVWADQISGLDVRMYVCGSLDSGVCLKFRLGLDFDLHMHKMCA